MNRLKLVQRGFARLSHSHAGKYPLPSSLTPAGNFHNGRESHSVVEPSIYANGVLLQSNRSFLLAGGGSVSLLFTGTPGAGVRDTEGGETTSWTRRIRSDRRKVKWVPVVCPPQVKREHVNPMDITPDFNMCSTTLVGLVLQLSSLIVAPQRSLGNGDWFRQAACLCGTSHSGCLGKWVPGKSSCQLRQVKFVSAQHGR